VLLGTLAANAVFMVVEVVGGLAFHSLALLADAAHMLSDVAALGIALVAHTLLNRPASARHSFGLQRAEVLGAQANGVLLVVTGGWVLAEAFRRVGDAPDVDGAGLLAVAVGGLVVNLASALALGRAQGTSVNVRGAVLHMAADAAGSVGAIAAGVAVVAFGADWTDPAISVLIGGLVLWAAWRLLRETTHVLLEGTPESLDVVEVSDAIAATDGVSSVHHLHAWSIASDTPALSAHVVLEGEPDLHEAQARGDELRRMLLERFGVGHATLELECHHCADAATGDAATGAGAT
jgi:cobalt-zinc-cadmium efflux system protein